MMSAVEASAAAIPVTVILHRRVLPEQDAAYGEWQDRISTRVMSWPGFLERRVLPPHPPAQQDWTIVQRFRDADSARAWLESDVRAQLDSESSRFAGLDSVHLLTAAEETPEPEYASVMISSRVPDELAEEFLAWQRRISDAESLFDGFIGHRVEHPVPGVQDDWTVILTFDTDEHLTRWLESPVRAKLLEEGTRFNTDLTLTRTSYGFGFWNRQGQQQDPVFKSNLLVLLVLYPVVFLWGYFIGDPLLGKALGMPFWLALFIGNVVSTQILGFWLAPLAFKAFAKWMRPKPGWQVQLTGYAILAVLYAVSMAIYAFLLTIPL